jgi:hypothetical protein
VAANDLLRAARQRTASLTSPDVCLSRQELAELVNAWVWDHHEKTVEHGANWVGQLERGKIRWPGTVSREAIRAILGVSTDAALGFVNARSARAAVKLEDVDRKQFLHTTGALGVGTLVLRPVAALLDATESTPVPSRVGMTEIEQTRTAAQVFSSWDFAYGGGLARDAVMGQLRWSAGLLDAACPDQLRPELFSVVGYLADTAGYMAFDAGAYEDARQVLSFALACAEQAGDWHLRACVPDRGRALARMRRVNETLTAIGTAEDHFARSTPADDPPFSGCYNAAFLAGNTGHALFDLAILGHHRTQATDRLTAAVTGHTASHPRSAAICQTKLASLTMATGDPIHAVAIGAKALDVAGSIRSRRVTDNLRELARYATEHQHLDAVAQLRHRISTLVCTDSP